MKNIVKLFGIIVLVALIGFSMAACGGDDDDDGGGGTGKPGKLTITDLSDYNDKYAIAISGLNHTAAASLTQGEEWNPTITGGKISGGSVTLNVYQRSSLNGKFGNYNGNETVSFAVTIMNESSYTEGGGYVASAYLQGNL